MKKQIKPLLTSIALVVFVALNTAQSNLNHDQSSRLLQISSSDTSVLLPQNPMGGHKDGNGKDRGNR